MVSKAQNRIMAYLRLLIIFAVLLALLGASGALIDSVVSFFLAPIIGAIFSAVATQFVESLTGDLLKHVLLTIEVRGYRFSISLFAIATFIVSKFLES